MGNSNSSSSWEDSQSSLQRSIPDLVNVSFEDGGDDEEVPAPSLVVHKKHRVKSVSLPSHWKFRLRSVDTAHGECPVCTTPFEKDCIVTLLPCGHYFCNVCITQWINCKKTHHKNKNHKTCSTCPICRYELRTKNNKSSPQERSSVAANDEQDGILTSSSSSSSSLAAPPSRILLEEYLDQDGTLQPLPAPSQSPPTPRRTMDRNFDLIMAKMLQAESES